MHLVAGRRLLALHQHAGIDGVFQHTQHRTGRPKGLRIGLEGGGILHAQGSLIFHGREYAELIELIRYVLRTDALQLPREDVPHEVGGVFVHDELVLVLWVLLVAIDGKGAEILAALALYFKLRAYLDRNIPAVSFVYEVFERNDEVVGGFLVSETVVVVVDRDKADAKEREYLFDILSGVEIVSPKTGEVFYNNTVGAPGLYVLDHLLKIRALEGRAAPSVIHPDGVFPKLRMLCEKIAQKVALPCNAVGFLLISIVAGQTEIESGIPDFVFLHNAHSLSQYFSKTTEQRGVDLVLPLFYIVCPMLVEDVRPWSGCIRRDGPPEKCPCRKSQLKRRISHACSNRDCRSAE